MTELIVGICVIIVAFRLFTGGQRIALAASVVVGAYVGFAADLARGGVDVLGSLGGAVERLGSLGGSAAVIALAVLTFPFRPGPLHNPDGRVNLLKTCGCGKDRTPEAHGWIGDRKGFTCSEIRVMRGQVERWERRRYVHRAAERLRDAAQRRAQIAARRVFGDERVDALMGVDQ